MRRVRERVPPEHPWFAGHYPGAPVWPGVFLVDLVARGLGRVTAVRELRLLVPVRPGDEVVAEVRAERDGGRVRAECVVAGRVVARMRLELADA